MKNKTQSPFFFSQPSESDIRDYAYLLYAHSGGAPGHDLDHWFEASAFLRATIPPRRYDVHHSPLMADPAVEPLSIDS